MLHPKEDTNDYKTFKTSKQVLGKNEAPLLMAANTLNINSGREIRGDHFKQLKNPVEIPEHFQKYNGKIERPRLFNSAVGKRLLIWF